MPKLLQQALSGKSILLSGGTGFIGKNIIKYLIKNNVLLAKLTIITRNVQKFKKNYPELACLNYIDYIESDICHLNYIGDKYDYVIHGATTVGEAMDSLSLVHDIINGTENILNFAIKSGAKSVINLSSGAVYGKYDMEIGIKESQISCQLADNINSTYGTAKLMAEHMSYLYASKYKIKVSTLRIFALGGDYLDGEHYALNSFIKAAINKQDIVVNAGSKQYRSYLSIDDMIEWLLYIMVYSANRDNLYDTYNIGSDTPISFPDLAKLVKLVLSSDINISCPNINDGPIMYYVPNIDKVKSLGLTNTHDLPEIIKTMADYYKKRSLSD